MFDQGALRCLSLLSAAMSTEACSLTRRVRSRVAQKHVFALIRVDIAPKFVEHLKANQSSLAEESFTLKSGLSEEDKVGGVWSLRLSDRSLLSLPCFLPGSAEGCVLRELHGPVLVHGAAQLLPLLRKRLLRALRLQTGRSVGWSPCRPRCSPLPVASPHLPCFHSMQCTLPPQYGVHSRVRVCDMCR